MGAIESIKYNYGFLRTLMGSGRERYFAATHTLVKIEKEYRQFKSDSKSYHSHDVEHELAKIHTKAASMVANLCRENGAMWVKFAQFLSCRPDILPLQFIAPLQSLQCEAKSAHFEEIHPLIIESWGQSWDDHFRSFDAVPVATASVAQVHRAVLRSGQEVAVKLQLPNARTYFEQDSLVFTTLARALGPLVKELDVQQVVAQLLSLTLEELDFAREAENLRQFRSLAHLPGIVTPALVEDLSGQKIMVTSWAEGTPLADYLRQNPDRAIPLLNRIQASYLQQITQLGVYHADPHPGNFIVTENEDIVILDFGAICRLNHQERLNYTVLLLGIMGHHDIELSELFSNAGFVCDRSETLQEIADFVVGDNPEQLSVSERLRSSMDKLRKNRVKMPDSFVAMARVIITIGGFLDQYDVDFLFEPAEFGVKG